MNDLVWLPFKGLRALQPVKSLVGSPFHTMLYEGAST